MVEFLIMKKMIILMIMMKMIIVLFLNETNLPILKPLCSCDQKIMFL